MLFSIVNYGELDKKSKTLSAEFYDPFVVKLDKKYKDNSRVSFLKDIGKVRDFGSFSLYNSINYLKKNDKNGIPFIRVVDISESSINTKNSVKIDEESNVLLKKSKVFKGDLLYSIIGTLGVCAFYNKENPSNSNQSLAKITITKKTIDPLYVCLYLNSEVGKKLALRGESGGVQKHITLQRAKEIPIYFLDENKQEIISELYRKALNLYNSSENIYEDIEKDLIFEMELDKIKTSKTNTFYEKFSKLKKNERWDANFFLPKFTEIDKRIRNYKNGFGKIEDFFKLNKKSFIRDKNFFNYIEIGDVDIHTSDITIEKRELFDLPDNAKIKLNKGDLLFSKVRPYRGAVTIFNKELKDTVGSSAFTVLQESGIIKKEVLFLLLRTRPYKELIMRFNVGTSYPVVKDNDVLSLPVPILREEFQDKIINSIKKYFLLREEAKESLSEAKEILIKELKKELKI